MTHLDMQAALLKALELGLKGDSASVWRYGRQLLKRLGRDGSPLRDSLTRMLAERNGRQHLRSAEAPAGAVMGDAEVLSRVEILPDHPSPVLPASEMQSVQDVIVERLSADELSAAGLSPIRTVLLVGPPGVGKTMTARFIAAEADLPLITIDMSGVMSRFLGRTGQNLRLALEQARLAPSVCLLDEFDALGKKRDDPGDVGELKRIVTVVLQELETWPEHGLLIAATNHPELLDRAVWRRFDRIIRLELPTLTERPLIVRDELARKGHEVSEDALLLLACATEGWSGSDLARLAKEAVRGVVLARWSTAERGVLKLLVRDAVAATSLRTGDPRDELILLATQQAGLSQRATARLLGLSHVTVGKVVQSRQ